MPIDVWDGTEIVCRGFRPWCCDTGSSSHFTKLVTSSNPHGPSVTDPCLTCRRCSHPHAHHTLACPSTGKDELSRWRWSDTHTCTTRSLSSPLLRADTRFLLASRTYFSFSLSLSLAFFRPAFFRLRFPFTSLGSAFPLRTDLLFILYLWAVSVGAVCPKLTPPHLRTITMITHALSKKAGVTAPERKLLRKNKSGLQSSRKNIAEEK